MDRKDATFPVQKVSLVKKTREWKETCVDSVIGIEESDFIKSGDSRKGRMNIADGLYNSNYDEEDLKYVTNPFDVKDGFPAKMQEFNQIRPKVDLLIGEESKRPFNIRVIQTNDKAVGNLQEQKKGMLLDYVMQQITGGEPQTDEQGNPITPAEIEKYMKYTYKTIAEETAFHSLKYLKEKLNLTNEFLKGWKDGLVYGEEIYYIGARNGEPSFERVDPRECDYDQNPNLEFVEEGDKFVRHMYMSAESIYDRYFDLMDESKLDALLQHANENSSINTGSKVNTKSIIYKEKISNKLYDDESSNFLLDVWHAVWSSYTELGFLEMEDENGETETVEVDRNYKVQEGDKITWEWVREIWEGYRVSDDLYFGIGPVEHQNTSIEDPTSKKLPYCGIRYNDSGSKGKSLALVMKPLQYMYIILWYRLELALARDKGKIINMDITQIPKGLGIDVNQWMHYLTALGVNFINPYDEGWDIPGREGGKPSPHNQIGQVDLTMGSVIAEYVNLMGKIEEMIGEISGVSKARQGQIHERSLVGNVEREVIQSSHITEPLFWKHGQAKKNGLSMLLNVAKSVWSEGGSKKLHYILNDTARIFLDITDDFLYSDMDIFLTDATKENQDIEAVKTLLQPAMQAGASLLDAVEIISGENMTEMKKKLTEIEKKKEQMIAAQQQAEQQQAQIEAQMKGEEMRIKEEDSIRRSNTDIEVALIRAEAGSGEGEDGIEDDINITKLELQRQKQDDDKELKDKQLSEVIREAKKAESQKQEEIVIKRKVANKPVIKSK